MIELGHITGLLAVLLLVGMVRSKRVFDFAAATSAVVILGWVLYRLLTHMGYVS